MDVLVTGSTGFLGSAVVEFLEEEDHKVLRLVRGEPEAEGEIRWDPAKGTIDKAGLEALDGVVHLAGENIAKGRWTAEKKQRIRDSRVKGTRLLCETLAGLERPPKVIVSASAIGYYGSRGDEVLTEQSPPGTGFLADLGKEWEKATEPAAKKGIRVVILRIGVVLHPAGGALGRMLTPFKLGMGGRLGPGTQYFPWISLDDVVGAVVHGLTTDGIAGPVNAMAPNPITNLEFTKTLGKVLRRPTTFPMPAFAVRLAFGELADEALLSSVRAEPERLLDSGFEFQHPRLEGALRALLGK